MPRTKKVVDEKANEALLIAQALKELAKEKGLSNAVVVEAMGEALKKAYFKYSGDYTDTKIKVTMDLDTGVIYMAKIKEVVAEIEDDVFQTDPEEAFEETGIHYNIGDIVETPIDISAFRRAAAMQAKSVFKQKLREAEKKVVVDNFANKVGSILTGTVEAVEAKHCIIKLQGSTNAYLNKAKMLPGESLELGRVVSVYVEEVDKQATGAPIIVSRTHPRFVTCLMERDIGEIHDGIVEIKGIARQPGSRSKVAVYSKDPSIDPSGACIGHGGSRLSQVTSQLANEKIDVINYSENPLIYIADALKPAVVRGVRYIDEENKAAQAIVDDSQFSLAIGKEAQNVNLAVRLTGWKIDIKPLSVAEENGIEYQSVEDLRFMENARRNVKTPVRPTVVAPSAPVVDEVESISIVDEPSITIEPTAPVIDEVKPVATPKEEKPVVRPTRSKSTNVFSELEAALNASSSSSNEPTPAKKKTTKKVNKDDEFEDEVVDTKKATPAAPSSNVLPVYTEEELRAIAEEEEAEEDNKYDDEIDYDEFDEYYDDEN